MRPGLAALLFLCVAGCEEASAFDPLKVAASTPGSGLQPGFLLGAATAAHQIEGGLDNDWTRWELSLKPDGGSHVKDGSRSGRAVGSWELWRDDVAALQGLRANTYRLSIEWSRLEPDEGRWDEAALQVYREQLTALREAGIEPFVTLWHFSLPKWVADRGGWEDERTFDLFEAFARRVGAALGEQVDWWITINEPTIYSLFAYGSGDWPPGVADVRRASRVYRNLMFAHARAAAALRATDLVDADGDGFATRIGLSHHVSILQNASSGTLDATIAALTDDWANEAVPRANATGRMRLYVPGAVDIDDEVPGMQGSFDYLGLNQYYRMYVRGDFGSPSLSTLYSAGERSDVGGEIYPEGLYRLIMRFKSWGLPIVITENGIADAADARRPEFLRQTFYALKLATAGGADVRGYIHWTLMDNFEWAEGFSAHFGLYAVDPSDPNLIRTPRPSVEVFREAAIEAGARR